MCDLFSRRGSRGEGKENRCYLGVLEVDPSEDGVQVSIVDSIVLGQAAGVEHVSFYSRTVHLISSYNEP